MNSPAISRISIGIRLGIVFGFLIAILLGAGWIGVIRMGRTNAELNEAFDRHWAKVQLAQDAAYQISVNNRITMEIFLSGRKQDIPRLLASRAQNMAAVYEDVRQIQVRVESPQEKRLLDGITHLKGRYLDSYARALDLLTNERNPEKARQVVSTEIMPALGEYRDNWNAFVRFEREQMDQARDMGQADFLAARYATELLILLGTLLAAGIAVFATRRLVREAAERDRDKLEIRKLNESLEWKVSERTRQLSRLAAVVESSGDAIFRAAVDGTILSWNAAAHRMYGYAAADIVGQSVLLLAPLDHREAFRSLFERVKLTGKVEQTETCCVRKDGQRMPVAVTLSAVRDSEGNPDGVAAILRDITETKRMEGTLRQAQKMEAVGRLAGGVAHDFNNLLGVILGYSELLLEGLEDPALRNHAEQITKSGNRAAALIRQLLAFSRQQVLETKNVNLNTVIRDMSNLLPRLLGEHIEVHASLDPALSSVNADQGQIEQVVMNLAVNARDAMPEGGKLMIQTSNLQVSSRFAQQHPPMTPGDYVRLVVSDTGSGMDAETQARIFEPFFTTKAPDKGTGLGLSTVYGIVKQSGGYIWVHSEVGKGASFQIYFPRVDVEVSARASAGNPEAHSEASETILLVEDEPSLLLLARTFLEEAGYRVLEAANGAKALDMAREPGPIHLLLTDVTMPGMNGPALAEKVAAFRPDTRIVYMSAYAGFTSPGLVDSGAVILNKPFTRETLLQKVREVLDRAPALA